ncbi:hypothetical protein ACF08B_41005 [Streptomyces sp. NPDC015139]|uniref:hypothetical protein n=1 Tax=Streptomyces sp. NPDC015139 TaxID=3364942 RepID=UPI0036FD8CB1
MVKQHGKGRRILWWWLLFVGAATGIGGYVGGTRYYQNPETRDIGNVAFWVMLAGGWLALYAGGHLVESALQRGVGRFFAGIARRSAASHPTVQRAHSDEQDAVGQQSGR